MTCLISTITFSHVLCLTLPFRFDGRQCGFPLSREALNPFHDIVATRQSRCGDEQLDVVLANLEQQSGLIPPTNWATAVEFYMALKNMSRL